MREQSHVRGNAGKWRDAKGDELKKYVYFPTSDGEGQRRRS